MLNFKDIILQTFAFSSAARKVGENCSPVLKSSVTHTVIYNLFDQTLVRDTFYEKNRS